MAPPQPRSDVPTLGTPCSHPWQLHSPSEQLLGEVPIEGSHLCHQSPPSQFGDREHTQRAAEHPWDPTQTPLQ